MQPPSLPERYLGRRHWLGLATAGATVGLIHPPWMFARQHDTDSKQLIVHGAAPMNAEPALSTLVQSWETPVKHFYVRSHAPVPKVDLDSFRVTIEGMLSLIHI